jgi:hypothetical protein
MHLVDPAVNHFDEQVVYLDFDGAKNVTYRGPVTVGPFDVAAFKAPTGMTGQEQAIEAQVLNDVRSTFADSGVQFTIARPAEGAEYSTVYIGGDDSAFRSYGHFEGLAEDVDAGNRNHTDAAIVFSANVIDPSQWGRVVEHEIAHLLGYAHDFEAAGEGLLAQVAYSNGSRVQANANLIIRTAPPTLTDTTVREPVNGLGTVTAGPTAAYLGGTLYNWYNVTGDDGKSGWSADSGLNAVAAAAPSISNVSPTSYAATNSNQAMLINGASFQSGATVTYHDPQGNAYVRTPTFVSSTQLSHQFNDASDSGTWTVFVTNPDGKTSSTLSFTVAAVVPAPSISNVSPTS